MNFYKTNVQAVGPEVESLLEGGVLVLYQNGAPPELAEVSVLHEVESISDETPSVGSLLKIGSIEVVVTAMGDTAWSKVRDIGHVVINFNGADKAERPGEICVEQVNLDAIKSQVVSGVSIELESL